MRETRGEKKEEREREAERERMNRKIVGKGDRLRERKIGG